MFKRLFRTLFLMHDNSLYNQKQNAKNQGAIAKPLSLYTQNKIIFYKFSDVNVIKSVNYNEKSQNKAYFFVKKNYICKFQKMDKKE